MNVENFSEVDLVYSCLQNHWRELPRSGRPTNFWHQRPAMAGEKDFSNVGVIDCVGSFLSRLEIDGI